MGFDRQDLLRSSEFTEGDFLPLVTYGSGATRQVTTTSTSYADNSDLSNVSLIWDDLPIQGETAVSVFIDVITGSGESVDLRFQNRSSSETIAEQQGITAGADVVKLGPVPYEPTDTTARNNYRIQFRTNPGTNDTFITDPIHLFGANL